MVNDTHNRSLVLACAIMPFADSIQLPSKGKRALENAYVSGPACRKILRWIWGI